MKWLLTLYPCRWQRRYSNEFVALLEERGFSLTVLLGVHAGALDAYLHPELVAVPETIGGGGNPTGRRDRFDKFTRRSRTLLDLAAKEAERLGHPQITTEHLLLGMLLEGEGLAAQLLAEGDANWRGPHSSARTAGIGPTL